MPVLELTPERKFFLNCTYGEREIPKRARFRWDPAIKKWWTKDVNIAASVAKFAPPELRRQLEGEVVKVESTIALSRATNLDVDFPCNPGMDYLPYQKAGIQWELERESTLLADDMGLGKTVQGIGLINADPSIKTVLIVCPASLKLNWQKELRKWLVRQRPMAIVNDRWPYGFDIVITNYDVLKKWQDPIRAINWDLLIVDEAHYVKNGDTRRASYLMGAPTRKKMVTNKATGRKELVVSPPIPGITATKKVFMTGTPIENAPGELWALLNYLQPGEWGNEFLFKREYCSGSKNKWGWEFKGASNLEKLQNRLRSTVMIRRKKMDVLTELPPKRRQVIEIPAGEAIEFIQKEQAHIRLTEAKMIELRTAVELAKASDNQREYEVAVQLLKEGVSVAFTQIAKLRHDTAVAKIPYVVEHLRNCLDGGVKKLVVFAHHIDVILGIEDAFNLIGKGECVQLQKRADGAFELPGSGTQQIATIDGDSELPDDSDQARKQIERARSLYRWPQNQSGRALTMYGVHKMHERQAAVEKFQSDVSVELIIGGIGPMGTGHTLTASSHVVFAELDWVPSRITQAEDRTHRIGQNSAVIVQHLVLEGSLDAKMANKMIDKQRISDAALDDQEMAAGSNIEEPADEDIETANVTPWDSEQASTKSVKRDQIERDAKRMTPAQIELVHDCLGRLSGMCDGARQIDGSGFNKMDSGIGKSLAQSSRLSPKQAALGRRLVLKYRGQLGGDSIAEALELV